MAKFLMALLAFALCIVAALAVGYLISPCIGVIAFFGALFVAERAGFLR